MKPVPKRIENKPHIEVKKKKTYNTKNKKYLLEFIKKEIDSVKDKNNENE